MKKNEEKPKAITKNLTWKLKELPNAAELAQMVDAGIISTDEARDMAFGSPESDKDRIKALEEQIVILQELIENLFKQQDIRYVPFERVITVPRRNWEYYWSNGLFVNGNKVYNVSSTPQDGNVRLTMTTSGNIIN